MRLFLNEQISPVVSERLREQGYDVVSPHDLATWGQSDLDQITWSVVNGQAVVTYNIADFRLIADQYLARGQDHFGLILVSERTISQGDPAALLGALEAALRTYPEADALRNQVVFLQPAVRLHSARRGPVTGEGPPNLGGPSSPVSGKSFLPGTPSWANMGL